MGLSDRFGIWLAATRANINGASVELSCRGEIVEEFAIDENSNPVDLIAELEDAAQTDCDSEGRSGGRTYSITMVGPEERIMWPGKLRKSPTNTVHMAKMVTDLHNILSKSQKDHQRIMNDMVRDLRADNQKFHSRQLELFSKLEAARSKELERKMALDEHEKQNEFRERVADVALPALVAVAQSFAGIKELPPADLRALGIREIARGMTEKQVDAICGLVDDPTFGNRLADAVDGKVDVDYFLSTIKRLDESKAIALFQMLNPGQQSALQAVLKAS